MDGSEKIDLHMVIMAVPESDNHQIERVRISESENNMIIGYKSYYRDYIC